VTRQSVRRLSTRRPISGADESISRTGRGRALIRRPSGLIMSPMVNGGECVGRSWTMPHSSLEIPGGSAGESLSRARLPDVLMAVCLKQSRGCILESAGGCI
jgi:hypothetical protein